jgi:hypothetical protein
MFISRFAPALVVSLALVFSGCSSKSDPQADTQKQLEEAQKQLAEAQQKVDAAKSQAAAPGAPAAQPAAAPSPVTETKQVPPPPPPPKVITLAAGTAIPVRTLGLISTKTATNGAPFEATLEKELVVDGELIAARGANVTGVVVNSDPGGKVKGVASIALALTSVQTSVGKVKISTASVAKDAKSTVKKDVTRGAIMTGAGAAIGAIAGGGRGAAIGAGVGAGAGVGTAMMTKGAAAEVPAETPLTFTLAAPVTVTIQK